MKERFFLDRIALQRPDVALRNVERASLIEPNFADARQAVENDAPMAAREAPHAVVGQLLVKNAFDSTLCKNVFEGARFSGPGCQSLSPKSSSSSCLLGLRTDLMTSPGHSTPDSAPASIRRGDDLSRNDGLHAFEVHPPVYTLYGTTNGAVILGQKRSASCRLRIFPALSATPMSHVDRRCCSDDTSRRKAFFDGRVQVLYFRERTASMKFACESGRRYEFLKIVGRAWLLVVQCSPGSFFRPK